eukprot:TRINITY_DN2234_c0_g2_i2.p1 TRINITY_DN2234_c0_g2~~TRINITY_DN2234_c0_g2_i2.p1  ORF type:complete len:178 (-),score=54.46 TRINITY_DN2234_c0_g2_i2:54-587(-)
MGASTIDTDVNDELVQIVDEENKAVKGAPRWVMRKQNLPHRSSYVFIYNSKKQLYVQMRTLTKDYLPGYYTLCTGGVVQVDEPDLVNAKREVAEEMGIENSVLNFIATKHYKDDKVDVWQNIYTLYYNGPVNNQKEEVDHVEMWDIDEVLDKEKAGLKICPDTLAAFKVVRDSLTLP